MVTGVLARSALIKSIYKRGVNLTGKARTKLSNADLVNHISTDVSDYLLDIPETFEANYRRSAELMLALSGL